MQGPEYRQEFHGEIPMGGFAPNTVPSSAPHINIPPYSQHTYSNPSPQQDAAPCGQFTGNVPRHVRFEVNAQNGHGYQHVHAQAQATDISSNPHQPYGDSYSFSALRQQGPNLFNAGVSRHHHLAVAMLAHTSSSCVCREFPIQSRTCSWFPVRPRRCISDIVGGCAPRIIHRC